MTVTRQSLAEHFGRLNDGELIAEFQSGALTELAQEVAAAEIRSRNIDIADYEAEPPTLAEPEAGSAPASRSDDLVMLARFIDVSSAYLLQSRLDAEGVPSIVADALAYQNVLFGAGIGGVRVLVPESYLARAADIKARIDRGDYTLDDKADIDRSDGATTAE